MTSNFIAFRSVGNWKGGGVLYEIFFKLKYAYVFFKFMNFCVEYIYHVYQYFTKKQQLQEIFCQLILMVACLPDKWKKNPRQITFVKCTSKTFLKR